MHRFLTIYFERGNKKAGGNEFNCRISVNVRKSKIRVEIGKEKQNIWPNYGDLYTTVEISTVLFATISLKIKRKKKKTFNLEFPLAVWKQNFIVSKRRKEIY